MQAETKPRYTVELTTEGWQIKDNVKGTIRASVYGRRDFAEEGCRILEAGDSVDAATGQGHR